MADGDETQAMAGGGDDRTQAMSGGGGDTTQVALPTGGNDDEGGNRKPIWMILLGILVVGLLIGGGIAIAGGGGDDKEEGASTSTSSSTTSSSSTSTSSTSTTQGTTATTSAPNPGDDPKIDSYNVNPGTITCAMPTDSKSVTLTWATSNTSQVVLSVDGPGPYGTYGPSGSQSIGIGCPAAGTSAQHTYTLTAKGPNGPDATQTINYSINTIP